MDQKVSIIIPCREIDAMTEKCIAECLKLDYDNFEILVFPDKKDKEKIKSKKLKIIETGKVKPSFKRNLGMKKAKGKFLAFIDSDAYPRKDWLRKAIKYFDNEEVGIVGGPNLTPKEANFMERASGYALSNFLASGAAHIRYKIKKNRYVKELPSCNYISRKEISPKYDVGFLTAEDSKFCFDVAKKGYKVLYAGDVIVYHHRRDTFRGHVKQMFIYGRDIAWLSKQEFSIDKSYYSLLSLFVICASVLLVLFFFSQTVRLIFFILASIYTFLILVTSIHENIRMTLSVIGTVITTHFAYGFGWLYGILNKCPIVKA